MLLAQLLSLNLFKIYLKNIFDGFLLVYSITIKGF